MRNDVPAVYPLIAFIAGLAAGPLLVNPGIAVAGLLAIAVLRPKVAAVSLLAALAAVLALRTESREAAERAAFAQLHPERFVTIEATLERDWAARETSFVLRASRFRANGVSFDAPIAIWAAFEPPEIAMEATLRAEGFLRINDRGEYTANVKSPVLLTYEGRLASWHPAAWNRAMANRLEAHAAAWPNEVALAQALLLGRGERLTEEMRESFRRGGTYHLLVFSALQIAFAAGLLAALLRWLHAPRASDWLLLGFAVIAPLFIGPTPSVSRASVGIGLYALSRIAKRPTSLQNLWCVAALLRLAIEPRDLTDVSFHLTYAGAGALLFIGKELADRRWLAHALAAEIAITPLTLFHFRQYALGGSILTIAMTPVIFAALILSALACALPWRPFFLAIRALHRACETINVAGVSGFFTGPPVAAMIGGGAAALFALALPRGRKRAIAISLAMLLPTAVAVVRGLAARSVEHPRVTFFDVGQGDAIAVRSGPHTLLVDGGRDRRLLTLLADRGIRRIDAVVLSHAHPDHCTALPNVIERFDVREVWISPRRFHGDCATRILAAAIASRTPVRIVRDGDVRRIGDLRVTVRIADRRFRRAPENNASVVLRVEAGGRRFLLAGDIEKEAEIHFSDEDITADVLKVAHHGSRSSTSHYLLDAVMPRLAVISCGRRNRFGHPHPSVLDALAERRVRTWRTDRDGSIDIDVVDRRFYVSSRND